MNETIDIVMMESFHRGGSYKAPSGWQVITIRPMNFGATVLIRKKVLSRLEIEASSLDHAMDTGPSRYKLANVKSHGETAGSAR